jgi:hypothetical protein
MGYKDKMERPHIYTSLDGADHEGGSPQKNAGYPPPPHFWGIRWEKFSRGLIPEPCIEAGSLSVYTRLVCKARIYGCSG